MAFKKSAQLELPLEWRLTEVKDCPHNILRYEGIQEGVGEVPSFPLYTCSNPHGPHCGGSFDGNRFPGHMGSIMHEGSLYVVKNLSIWYRGK